MADPSFRFSSATLPEETFQVIRVNGVEGLSRPFEYRIQLVSQDPDVDVAGLIRNNASLDMIDAFGADVVTIHGILAEFEQGDRLPGGRVVYHTRLVPRIHGLTLNSQCQIYQDLSVPDIIRDLLKEDGLSENEDFRLSLKRTDYPVMEYVVQYQESDWSFLSRLMEHVGIYYHFEQGQGRDVLVMVDDRQAHTAVSAEQPIAFRDAREVNPGGETVSAISLRQQMKPANVVLRDYNWRAPQVEMLASAVASNSGRGTVMGYGDHFKDPTEGSFLAVVRAQELACGESVYRGKSAVRSFRPGGKFTLTDHFRSANDREYLLTEVRHIVEQLSSVGTAAGGEADQPIYRNEFTAIPSEVQFRPARLTPKPRIYGTINAVVESSVTSGEYADIDALGRYKVRLPFDQSTNGAGKASRYIRMAQPYAGDEYGMHFPLHAGTEVLLTHVDGDPDRPIISAAVPNAVTPSPVTTDNQSQSVMKTAGDNHIIMEDTAGSRFVQLSSPEEANGSSFIHLGAPGDLLSNMVPPAAPEATVPNDRIKVILSPKVIAVPVYGSYMLIPTVLYALSDPSVTWSLDQGAEFGTITEDGLYVAPPEVGEGPTIVVARATSNENPAKYDECRIVLSPPYEEMKRLYLAPQTVRMEMGTTMQLSAIPVGVNQDEAPVGWKVIGGDANGTVSLNGLYTPPATAPSGPVTVRAYLLVDPSNYAETQITVFPSGSRVPGVLSVTISPRSVKLGPGETALFRATVTGQDPTATGSGAALSTAVTWECDGPGTIDAGGTYTAPAGFSSPSVVNIRARSVAQTSRIGEAQTILYQPPTPPITILVDPENATISADMTQQFTAAVVGNANTNVRWEASAGSISTTGLFTPAGAGSVVIRAISLADESYVGATQITVLAAGALIAVTVTPGTADVIIKKTQLFTATVAGSSNTDVTWEVAGGGTIDATGLYKAPDDAPGAPVTITARSAANTAKTGTATVTVLTTAPVATFKWDKIKAKVTSMIAAQELAEGDITVAANNSVGLTRLVGITETQKDSYASVIGDSWSYVKQDADSLIEGKSHSEVHSGSISITYPYAHSITVGMSTAVVVGLAIQATAGAFINFTMPGFWANIIIGGLTIDAYLGGKVTINMGRNWVFMDVDDYEVIDKTSTTSARDRVSLLCGPAFTGGLTAPAPPVNPAAPTAAELAAQAAFKTALLKAKITAAFTPGASAPETCTLVLTPDAIDFETVKPAGVMTFKVAATPVVTIKNTAVEIATTATIDLKAATKIELASATVNIAGSMLINGTAPPPPAPAPAPPPPVVPPPSLPPNKPLPAVP